MSEHYTDTHKIMRGSSIDIIERCAAFIRQCGDFEGILDYADTRMKFEPALRALEKEAMRIIARESR